MPKEKTVVWWGRGVSSKRALDYAQVFWVLQAIMISNKKTRIIEVRLTLNRVCLSRVRVNLYSNGSRGFQSPDDTQQVKKMSSGHIVSGFHSGTSIFSKRLRPTSFSLLTTRCKHTDKKVLLQFQVHKSASSLSGEEVFWHLWRLSHKGTQMLLLTSKHQMTHDTQCMLAVFTNWCFKGGIAPTASYGTDSCLLCFGLCTPCKQCDLLLWSLECHKEDCTCRVWAWPAPARSLLDSGNRR